MDKEFDLYMKAAMAYNDFINHVKSFILKSLTDANLEELSVTLEEHYDIDYIWVSDDLIYVHSAAESTDTCLNYCPIEVVHDVYLYVKEYFNK